MHEDFLSLKASDGYNTSHGGGDMVDNWSFLLIVQSFGLSNTIAHGVIHKKDTYKDHSTRNGKVRIVKTTNKHLKYTEFYTIDADVKE